MPALDDGPRAHERRHEERGDVPLGPADLDEVAKARRRDDRDGRAAALEHRIRADRRPVHDAPHVAARDAERVEAREHGRRLVAPARGNFGDHDAARRLVDRGEIGERAAHIDADEEHGRDDSRPTSTTAREARSRRTTMAYMLGGHLPDPTDDVSMKSYWDFEGQLKPHLATAPGRDRKSTR